MPSFKLSPAKEFPSFKNAASSKGRIAVLCTIVNLNPEELAAIASDASGEAKLLFESAQAFKKAKIGELVRVLGTAFLENNNVLINVESLQLMTDIDLNFYNKLKDLEANLKVV